MSVKIADKCFEFHYSWTEGNLWSHSQKLVGLNKVFAIVKTKKHLTLVVDLFYNIIRSYSLQGANLGMGMFDLVYEFCWKLVKWITEKKLNFDSNYIGDFD